MAMAASARLVDSIWLISDVIGSLRIVAGLGVVSDGSQSILNAEPTNQRPQTTNQRPELSLTRRLKNYYAWLFGVKIRLKMLIYQP
jgi:hypothetical protein